VLDSDVRRQIMKALANRETAGAGSEKTRAIKLLSELRSADIIPADVSYRHMIESDIVTDGKSTTTITLRLGRGYLQVQKGPLAGQQIVLFEGTASLGRGSKADIELPDPSVSRRHAEISVEGEDIRIQDMGSTNGTWVNGKQITTWRQLRAGDEIRLGDLLLVLHVADR
jgi:hypothetical protein